jgi:hypothetical protein
MKKSDLKTGMLVVFRSGKEGVVLLGHYDGIDNNIIWMFRTNTWTALKYVNEDLTNGLSIEHDVIEVYSTPVYNPTQKKYLLWEREKPVEELTLAEVCKELGREVKIIK